MEFGSGSGGDWPYGYSTYSMWQGAPSIYSNTTTYKEGTLALDVVDTQTNKLFFRETGTSVGGGQRNHTRIIMGTAVIDVQARLISITPESVRRNSRNWQPPRRPYSKANESGGRRARSAQMR